MKAVPSALAGVILLEPKAFADARGVFFESYNQRSFEDVTGLRADFVQDNESVSMRGVVRGMHYQLPPFAQGKLVRVVRGAIFDVVVDLRDHSPTFGQWIALELSGDNRRQVWIPEGFAHGFMALEDGTIVNYKVTRPYDRNSERSFRWDDPAVGIEWPAIAPLILSDKDAAAPDLSSAELPFRQS